MHKSSATSAIINPDAADPDPRLRQVAVAPSPTRRSPHPFPLLISGGGKMVQANALFQFLEKCPQIFPFVLSLTHRFQWNAPIHRASCGTHLH